MLDFIYYPVSAIMWFWHEVFGRLLGKESGVAWALSVVFLVWSLRVLLLKPFITQVRSMRKMQQFAPEIQKLKKKYGDDKQKMQAEMQKLQSEHGVNPLGGCLPVLVQVPVFIGIYHVLRSFNRVQTLSLTPAENRSLPNYIFSVKEVNEFLDARLFGVPLSSSIVHPGEALAQFGEAVSRWEVAAVAVPLTILAGILTHITARHSVARQSETQAANPQSAIMNKVMLYLFPLGVVGAGPFFPLGIVFYWLSNNTWTMAQQRVIYKKIDAEEAEKKEADRVQRENLGPRPGQKPQRARKADGDDGAADPGEPTEVGSEEAAPGSGSEAQGGSRRPKAPARTSAGGSDGTTARSAKATAAKKSTDGAGAKKSTNGAGAKKSTNGAGAKKSTNGAGAKKSANGAAGTAKQSGNGTRRAPPSTTAPGAQPPKKSTRKRR